mmetsp:Transcript_32256/g.64205  ORF Transcript_32256/g.64205 Transcript_32256/m.64205 type:complete len:339 (-) Transcript_32256:812-1828(-)
MRHAQRQGTPPLHILDKISRRFGDLNILFVSLLPFVLFFCDGNLPQSLHDPMNRRLHPHILKCRRQIDQRRVHRSVHQYPLLWQDQTRIGTLQIHQIPVLVLLQIRFSYGTPILPGIRHVELAQMLNDISHRDVFALLIFELGKVHGISSIRPIPGRRTTQMPIILTEILLLVPILVLPTIQPLPIRQQPLLPPALQLAQRSLQQIQLPLLPDVMSRQPCRHHIHSVRGIPPQSQENGAPHRMGGARLIELPSQAGQEVGEADGVEGEAAEGMEDRVGGGAGGEDVGGGEEGVAPVCDEAVGEGYGGDAGGGAGVVVGVVRSANGGGEFHEGMEELSL